MEVEHLVKEAVGLWRDPHNAKLYRSKKYIGGWILEKLGEEKKDNYSNSILHERIKPFILSKVDLCWKDPEMDNLRKEVESFVDLIHASIDNLEKKTP